MFTPLPPPSQSPNPSVRDAGQYLVRALARGVGVGGGAGGSLPSDTNAQGQGLGLALEEMVRGVFCDALGTKTGPNALVQPYQVRHDIDSCDK